MYILYALLSNISMCWNNHCWICILCLLLSWAYKPCWPDANLYFWVIWIIANICIVSLAWNCVLFLVCIFKWFVCLWLILSSVKVGMGSERTRFRALVSLAVTGLQSGAQKHSWLNPRVNRLPTGIQRTRWVALCLWCTSHSAGSPCNYEGHSLMQFKKWSLTS